MPFTVNEEKEFPFSVDKVFEAIKAAADGLQGKISSKNEENTSLQLNFNKTIHGKVLGDRTVLVMKLDELGSKISVAIEAYPVDAVGRKLMFGARKGVSQTVLDWFWAHLDHNLK